MKNMKTIIALIALAFACAAGAQYTNMPVQKNRLTTSTNDAQLTAGISALGFGVTNAAVTNGQTGVTLAGVFAGTLTGNADSATTALYPAATGSSIVTNTAVSITVQGVGGSGSGGGGSAVAGGTSTSALTVSTSTNAAMTAAVLYIVTNNPNAVNYTNAANQFTGAFTGNGNGLTLSGTNIASATNAFSFTPLQFGAVGDGVHDDTLAISNMFNAVNAAAGSVRVDYCSRSYSVSNTPPIMTGANIEICNGTIIYNSTNGAALSHIGNGAGNINIHNMTIYRPGAGVWPFTNNVGINLNAGGGNYTTADSIKNCEIYNFYTLIEGGGVGDSSIENNRLYDAWSSCIHFANSGAAADHDSICYNDMDQDNSPYQPVMGQQTNCICIFYENSCHGVNISYNELGGGHQAFKNIPISGEGVAMTFNYDNFSHLHTWDTNLCPVELWNGTLDMIPGTIGGEGDSNYIANVGIYSTNGVGLNLEAAVQVRCPNIGVNGVPTFDVWDCTGFNSNTLPLVQGTAGGGAFYIITHNAFRDSQPNYPHTPTLIMPQDGITFSGPDTFTAVTNLSASQTWIGSSSSSSDHQWGLSFASGDQSSYNSYLMGFYSYSGSSGTLMFIGDNNGNKGATEIYFDTSANGATSASRKWEIDETGNFLPQNPGTKSMGTSGNYLSSIYVTNVNAATVTATNFAGNGAGLSNVVASAMAPGFVQNFYTFSAKDMLAAYNTWSATDSRFPAVVNGNHIYGYPCYGLPLNNGNSGNCVGFPLVPGMVQGTNLVWSFTVQVTNVTFLALNPLVNLYFNSTNKAVQLVTGGNGTYGLTSGLFKTPTNGIFTYSFTNHINLYSTSGDGANMPLTNNVSITNASWFEIPSLVSAFATNSIGGVACFELLYGTVTFQNF